MDVCDNATSLVWMLAAVCCHGQGKNSSAECGIAAM